MTTSEDKIRALEIKLEEAQVRAVDLRLQLDRGFKNTERMARALAFVIGWTLHHHHHGEVRIPNADLVSEADCYEFETFPDVATAETVYRAVYHEEERKEVPVPRQTGYEVHDDGVIKTVTAEPQVPSNVILDPNTGKPFKFGGDSN